MSACVSSLSQSRKSVATWSLRLRGGVELAADGADALRQGVLEVHMDVLEVNAPFERPRLDLLLQVLEPRDDLRRLVLGQDTRLAQHGGVGDRARKVVQRKAPVEVYGGVKALHQLIGAFREAPAPHAFLFPSFRSHRATPLRLVD